MYCEFAIDIIINLLLGYEELRIYSFTVNAYFDIDFVSTVKELNVIKYFDQVNVLNKKSFIEA